MSPLLRFRKVRGSKPALETDYPKFISLVFQSNDMVELRALQAHSLCNPLRIITGTHDGKGKGQIYTHHVGMRKNRGTAPDILNLSTRRRRVVSCTSRPLYPHCTEWVRQSRSVSYFREEKNVFSLPRIKKVSFPFFHATPCPTKQTFPELA